MADKSSLVTYDEARACCFVTGCASHRSLKNAQLSTDDRRHFFSFPPDSTNSSQRDAWVLFCSRSDEYGNLLQPKTQPICDLHFRPEDIIKVSQSSRKSRCVKPLSRWGYVDGAIPTLNGPVKSIPVKSPHVRIVRKSSSKVDLVAVDQSPNLLTATREYTTLLEIATDLQLKVVACTKPWVFSYVGGNDNFQGIFGDNAR